MHTTIPSVETVGREKGIDVSDYLAINHVSNHIVLHASLPPAAISHASARRVEMNYECI